MKIARRLTVGTAEVLVLWPLVALGILFVLAAVSAAMGVSGGGIETMVLLLVSFILAVTLVLSGLARKARQGIKRRVKAAR